MSSRPPTQLTDEQWMEVWAHTTNFFAAIFNDRAEWWAAGLGEPEGAD